METCWNCGQRGILTTLVQRTGGYYRDRDCIFCKAHSSAPENMQARPTHRGKTMKLSDYEKDVLRVLNGEDVSDFPGWGAAMGAAIGFLKADGLVEKTVTGNNILYNITPAGIKALEG